MLLLSVFMLSFFAFGPSGAGAVELLNVSYDTSREVYQEYNPLFEKHWLRKTGKQVKIRQSHGGSSKQIRAVLDGLKADVITMSQSSDMDVVVQRGGGILSGDWRSRLPNDSSPYSSTIAFMVRRGQSPRVRDWNDLVKPGVSFLMPNPKTSACGRYAYLSARQFAVEKFNGDEEKVTAFMRALMKNVPVLDTGARGSTVAFVQREVGDVLVSYEAEIVATLKEVGTNHFELVTPSVSADATFPVAMIDAFAKSRGTAEVTQEYLRFMYSDEAQRLFARHGYRPANTNVASEFGIFQPVRLFKVEEVYGSWTEAMNAHFSSGGTFDRIYKP